MAPMPLHESTSSTDGASRDALCAIVTPVGMFGYGFEEHLLTSTLDELTKAEPRIPVAIIVDSGSTDSGPSKLALGSMTCPEASYRRDLTKLVRASIRYNVPVLLSSAGGDGSNEHVDLFVTMIKDITASLKCPKKLNILALYSEVSKDVVRERLEAGDITGCGDEVPALTSDEIRVTPRILAQMGPEPILKAIMLNSDFDIVVAGRAYDPAPFVAYCAMNYIAASSSPSPSPFESLDGHVLGGFYHMGKIMECGGLCATPKSGGATSMIYKDGTFDVSPMDPIARCVPLSVAAHTLYEKSRPDILHGPGGLLDLIQTTYEQLENDKSVRVRGAEFRFSVQENLPYTIKLEGARVIGYRTLFMGSFKDPILTSQIHEYLDAGRDRVSKQHQNMEGNWKLDFHVYGAPTSSQIAKGGKVETTGEVFVVGEVLADSPVLSKSVASTARVYCSHGAYKGQMATSGNFAFGIGGMTELDVGPCSQFSIYHLMNLGDGEQTGHLLRSYEDKIVNQDRTSNGLFPWQRIETEACDLPTNGLTANGAKAGTSTNGVTKQISTGSNGKVSTTKPMDQVETLQDVAKVIRSKNAGPFQVTFDIIFDDAAKYHAVKKSGLLSSQIMADLFDRPVSEVVWCGFFDQALAFKLTLPRKRGGEFQCSGGYMENDVHGSQQYLPLMTLPLSESLKSALQSIV